MGHPSISCATEKKRETRGHMERNGPRGERKNGKLEYFINKARTRWREMDGEIRPTESVNRCIKDATKPRLRNQYKTMEACPETNGLTIAHTHTSFYCTAMRFDIGDNDTLTYTQSPTCDCRKTPLNTQRSVEVNRHDHPLIKMTFYLVHMLKNVVGVIC